MDYKALNSILKNLNNFRFGNKSLQSGINEDDEHFQIYEAPGFTGWFVKITTVMDSYGDNECVKGVEFVQGKESTVTVYEYPKEG